MQGRLLPKYQRRYQAHPVGYWQDEFRLAAGLGLDMIEFILDFNDVEQNPLMQRMGIERIRDISTTTGVAVKTVCADYFMEAPLHASSAPAVRSSQAVLSILVENAHLLGVSDVVIPCVDKSRLGDDSARESFCRNIGPAIKQAEQFGMHLALETDLAPEPFCDLLERLDSPSVTVNYDTGNSASLGYNPVEEIEAYGSRISDIHLKDRLRDGGSVVLGTGAVDFTKFFHALSKTAYTGPFIMQAYRDDEGLAVFKKQLAWITPMLESYIPEKKMP